MLGEATTTRQVAIMASSAFSWEVMRLVTIRLLRGKYIRKDAEELAVSVVGTIHAVLACCLSLTVVGTNARPESLYERIGLSQITYAISSGYFAWDIYYVFFIGKFDPAFTVHAVACFLCYLFGQYPFLNYWGVYFLLFELSTPMLHARKALLLTGQKDTVAFKNIEKAFALVFFLARILMGFPMSYMVWRDLLSLLSEPKDVHSKFVAYYYLVANTALCGLNLFWFLGMVRKALAAKKNQ